jgi:methylmalonyl-CoA mutase cobalamin-binding domain/chain
LKNNSSRTQAVSPSGPKAPAPPARILTAVPICDGHDSAILTLNLEFARQGIEVIYLGYHRSVADIARAAIQEDVRAIGLSSYNGGHVEFFREVLVRLRELGAREIGLFGGGGGTISELDARQMRRQGVERIFFAGTPLAEMVEWVKQTYGQPKARQLGGDKRLNANSSDRALAKALTVLETNHQGSRAIGAVSNRSTSQPATPVVGITGPGGAGKTTLVDELALRFLQGRPKGRLAILSHDPSLAGKGAFLGDRASMVYAQDDRVFMRSLGTRGTAGGLAQATRKCLELLRGGGFDLVLVESSGIGQQDSPFPRGLVDKQILVMSPEYGGRLQLQKIAMLETADVVVLNKSDRPGAETARAEIAQRLEGDRKTRKIIATVAKRHRDAGVNELFLEVLP